jgi:PEP-CTERM motif
MRSKLVGALLAAGLLVVPSLWATAFDFSNCVQITSALAPGGVCAGDTEAHSLTYTLGGLKITAYGFDLTGGHTADNDELFVKTDAFPETGLGMASDVNGEVNTGNFINLDLSDLAKHGIFSGTLALQSLQTGEGYKVCQGETIGALGSDPTECMTGSGGSSASLSLHWTGKEDYIVGITALVPTGGNKNANVLVASQLSTNPNPVPEPGSLMLLSTGLFGIAGIVRRRLRSKV